MSIVGYRECVCVCICVGLRVCVRACLQARMYNIQQFAYQQEVQPSPGVYYFVIRFYSH